MKTYHKIQTVFKRDPETKFKTLLYGDYSLPEFEFLKDNEWVFTEKVDGTNIRVKCEEAKVHFAGKTDKAQIHGGVVDHLRNTFDPLAERIHTLFCGAPACLYGEGYGARIQKGGGLYRKDQGFVLFDIKVGDWWLQRKDVEDIAKELNIPVVPIIGTGTLSVMVETVRSGFYSQWGQFFAEGIVARPATELKTRFGERVIAKLKHRDFCQA